MHFVNSMEYDLTRLNSITHSIIGAGIKVHSALGPGLLESVYIACPAFELRNIGFRLGVQRKLPVQYEDVRIDCGFRLDIIVNEELILEIKSVKKLAPIHDAQLLTYLKLTGCPAGLLMNFNVAHLAKGVKRRLNPRPHARFLVPRGTESSR